MQPGCRDRIDLSGFEGNGAQHLVEIGRQQGIEDMPQAVIIQRGTCQPRLAQRHHAALFQPFSHLVEGMMPVQNREDQGFDPATTREPVCRVGRDEPISISVATSRRRNTPKIKGKWATG